MEKELAQLRNRYAVRSTAVMGARYSLVVSVEMNDKRHLVLRATPDPAARDQYAVLAALARLGVSPIVHEFAETETGTWMVVDRITPGTPIGDADWNDIDPAAVAAALRPLAGQLAPSPDLPSVFDWLRERLMAGDALADLAPGTQPAAQPERERTLAVLTTLRGSAGPPGFATVTHRPGTS